VSFLPLDVTSEDSVNTILSHIDNMMQYGEDEEPKVSERQHGADGRYRKTWTRGTSTQNDMHVHYPQDNTQTWPAGHAILCFARRRSVRYRS
jgi:hypothetical protein